MPRNLPPAAHRLIRSFAAAKRNTWSHEHVYNSISDLNALHAWLICRGLDGLTDAMPEDISDWYAELREAGRASSTVIGKHTRIKAFYKWAAIDPGDGRPYIHPNPILRVDAPKGDEDPDPANIHEAQEWEYRAFLETCFKRRTRAGAQRVNDRRDAAMIGLLWHCGIRRSELVRIRHEHVDFDTQMVHLAKTKGRSKTRSRDIFIPDEAMELLDRYLFERGDQPGPLFESIGREPGSRQRRPLAANSVYLMLRRRADVANTTQQLPDLLRAPVHGFRRAAAVAWLEAGGSQVTLETHMGWKHDGRMAARYTRKAATALAAAEARRVAEIRKSRHLRAV